MGYSLKLRLIRLAESVAPVARQSGRRVHVCRNRLCIARLGHRKPCPMAGGRCWCDWTRTQYVVVNFGRLSAPALEGLGGAGAAKPNILGSASE